MQHHDERDHKAHEARETARQAEVELAILLNIEQSIRASENMQDYFGDVLVVTQDVTEMRNGKRVTTKRKLFAGYVLVEMILNDETLHFLTNVPDVRSSSFVGPGNKPTPLSEAEVETHDFLLFARAGVQKRLLADLQRGYIEVGLELDRGQSGLPFLISVLLFHSFLSFFDKFRKHIRVTEIITGVLLMVVGVMLGLSLSLGGGVAACRRRHGLAPVANVRERAGAGELRRRAEAVLDAQQFVVLGDPVGTAQRTGLDLRGGGRHRRRRDSPAQPI